MTDCMLWSSGRALDCQSRKLWFEFTYEPLFRNFSNFVHTDLPKRSHSGKLKEDLVQTHGQWPQMGAA